MKNNLLYIMLTLLLFSSCRKDDIVDTNVNPPPAAEVFYEADIIGKVVDQDGNALENAIISNNGEEVMTDVNGLFRIKDLEMGANFGTFLEVGAEGYFESGYRIYAGGTYDRTIQITLVEKVVSGYVSGASGDKITLDGGLEIDFPANAFTANGTDYDGVVTVYAYHVDPSEEGYLDRAPGDLSGTDETGANYILESFGMVAVEMETADGQYVQLREGTTASLSVPVDDSLLGDAPALIPLWHFDEVLHKWVREGQAELINGSYVGQVSHFSWWNCDDFIDAASLCLQIFDGRYQGSLEGMIVELVSETAGISAGVTDIEGNVTGQVPANEVLQVIVYGICNEIVFSGSIGPYTGHDNKEVLPVVIQTVEIYSFGGTVFDCETMTVLSDAIVTIYAEGREYFAVTDQNGVYSIDLLICEEELDYVVSAFSLETTTQGTNTGTVSGAGVNLLDVNLCNEASFLVISDQDGNPIISETITVAAKVKPNEIIIWGSFAINGPLLGVQGTSVGTYPAAIEHQSISATASNCTVTLTKVESGIGGIIVGTIEGTNTLDNDQPFSGSFVANIVE